LDIRVIQQNTQAWVTFSPHHDGCSDKRLYSQKSVDLPAIITISA
jgi:hypothetical protein